MCMFPSLREKLNHSVVDIFSNEVVSILHKLVKSSEAIMELGGQWHWYLKPSCRYWTNQTLEILRSFWRYIRKYRHDQLYINTTGKIQYTYFWCLFVKQLVSHTHNLNLESDTSFGLQWQLYARPFPLGVCFNINMMQGHEIWRVLVQRFLWTPVKFARGLLIIQYCTLENPFKGNATDKPVKNYDSTLHIFGYVPRR